MRLPYVVIENFSSFADARISLDEKGLVAIHGVNHDDSSANSNGSGKSSLPDAVSWCSFGSTARGETGDAVIHIPAGKNCRVREVIADEDGYFYAVARHRKHKEHKNRLLLHKYKNLEDAIAEAPQPAYDDLTQGRDDLTQELVTKILGCSEQVFNTAIYAGQENMPNLPAMTDKNLKEIVEEAAGVNVLAECATEARAELLEVTKTVKALEAKVAGLVEYVTEQKELLDGFRAGSAAWVKSHSEQIGDASKRLVAEKTVHDKANQRTPALNKKRDQCDRRLAEIRTTISAQAHEKAELKRLDTVLATKNRDATQAKTKLANAVEQVKKQKAFLDTASARVGTGCTECGKEIEANDLTHVLTACKSQLGSAANDFRALKAAHETADAARIAAQTERDTYAAGMTDLSALSIETQELNDTIRKIDAALVEIEAARKKWVATEEWIKETTLQENPHLNTVAKQEEMIADREKQLAEFREKLEEAADKYELAEQVAEVFAPNGVRGAILDDVTPYLNARTSHYLSTLSDGNISAVWNTLQTNAKGEIREKFNIEVSSMEGGNSFGLLSGGEKRKVRLACALAMQDLVASRASKPIRIFIADEIDDAVDEAGLERLMTILDEKARERGTVLVISHRSLDDWIRDTATVEKRGKKSTISGVLNI